MRPASSDHMTLRTMRDRGILNSEQLRAIIDAGDRQTLTAIRQGNAFLARSYARSLWSALVLLSETEPAPFALDGAPRDWRSSGRAL